MQFKSTLESFLNYFNKILDEYCKNSIKGSLSMPHLNLLKKEAVNQFINSSSNTTLNHSLPETIKYVSDLQGKFFRASLAILGTEIFNGFYKDVFPAASAIELFHLFTLIHDDIMDNSTHRRGKPTIHTKWSMNDAILTGDYLFSISIAEISKLSRFLSFPNILATFSQAAMDVCIGQSMDLNASFPSYDSYITVVSLKTASLIRASLLIGAYLGRDALPIDELSAIGYNIGILFQFYDDFLDIFSSQFYTGKNTYSDICNGKFTLPVLILLKEVSSPESEKIVKEYKRLESNQRVSFILPYLETYGVKEKTINHIRNFLSATFEKIEDLRISPPYKEIFINFLQNFFSFSSY